MATFSHTYGADSMLAAVAEHIKDIEEPDTGDIDIHTITLILDGQHGEFNLVIEATDENLEDHRWEGIAHHNGGVTDLQKVET